MVIMNFSLLKNITLLVFTGKVSQEKVKCIRGLRVLSIFWIIFVSCYHHSNITYQDNQSWKDLKKNILFKTIFHNSFAFDTFFVISGFLAIFSLDKRLSFRYSKNISLFIHYFIRRICRILPILIFVLISYTFLLPYFLFGPFLLHNNNGLTDPEKCLKNGWANIFFVSNFLEPNKQVSKKLNNYAVNMRFTTFSSSSLFLYYF